MREVVLSGFDDHDTHHVISAFCADPSGAIYMGEGTFLHSHVETAYGPVRSSNGGFFRYSPQKNFLERVSRVSIPNPWGTAFDRWGQPFFLETSDPGVLWMTPTAIEVPYGSFAPKSRSLVRGRHAVRPTSGLEFVSSRHFPDEVQGDLLLGNVIGFRGIKQHRVLDDGAGYRGEYRVDLLSSNDPNFRPVDLEFASDGSLYLLDWHNVLIGHMQHSARDPLRDHVHGRVYRITYPSRPLVKPVKVKGERVGVLFEHLKLWEDRVRYRVRRELRGREVNEVMAALELWVAGLDRESAGYERWLLEGLWVSWGMDRVHEGLLQTLLEARDYRVRAAAVEVLRHNQDRVKEAGKWLGEMVGDSHARVRLQVATAASRFGKDEGLKVLGLFGDGEMDKEVKSVVEVAKVSLMGKKDLISEEVVQVKPTKPLLKKAMAMFEKGHGIYQLNCSSCHQLDGRGLPAAMFPPLNETKWVLGSEERLIKLVLHGLQGPIEVLGKKYPGEVPMTAFGKLSDEEIAAVLTYVRNAFGNSASAISVKKVQEIREVTRDQKAPYLGQELLEMHPR